MRATVTDADVMLGRIDADSFAGGSMRLDAGAARRNQQPLPRRMPEMHGDAATVHQRLPSARRVSVTKHLHAIEPFMFTCTGCPRGEYQHLEAIQQTTCKLVHEARLVIASPARIGGSQNQESRTCHR